ncbi:hypothetical protein [Arachidicoccus terrestris]|uniref:hypothetical protein n=1 Tax=Arachidicoccus terrestris TaxID=2875539 RepID=UPI001CC73F3B|nr:hypothetical protein [Arachidicoccus terrestris]UAY55391.1 hypothetical protein K9M52_18620 [Arachidicoccus terrestris]
MSTLFVRAQDNIDFLTDTAVIKPGSTIQLRARLTNLSHKSKNYNIQINTGDLKLINSIPEQYILAAHDSLFIPLILFAGRKTSATKPHLVTLKSISDSGEVLTSNCWVKLPAEKKVYLTVSQPDIYLKPGEDSVNIQIQVRNSGNSDQKFSIEMHGQPNNLHLIKKDLELSAFTDTVLSVRTGLPTFYMQHAVGHFLVTGNYIDGNVFSTIQVNIFNSGSSRNYRQDLPDKSGYNNTVGFFTRYLGTDMQYYELIGNGKFKTGNDDVQYELNALYYPSNYRSSFMLMNSHINYTTDKWNIRAGNIYRDDEMLLNGRGGSVQLKPSPSSSIRVGYLNNNYNLLGSFNDNYFNSGHTVYGDYSRKLQNNTQIKGLFIQQWDPAYKGNNTLSGGTIKFGISDRHYLKLGAYVSYHVKGLKPVAEPSSNWGQAALVSYSGAIGKWQLQSSNYFSSPSYAGYRKGAVNLLERIALTTDNRLNFWAQFSEINNHTDRIYNYFGYFNPSYENKVAEMGMNVNLKDNLSLILRPYYSYERSENGYIKEQYSYSIRGAHLDVGMNYNISNHENLYLKIDGGRSAANLNVYDHYFSFKLDARYSLGPFSINTIYQNSPYYSSELFYYNYTQKKYGLFAISPAFNGNLFQDKVSINAYNSIEYQRSYGHWSDNFNVNMTWHMRHNFNLVLNFNRLQYFTFDRHLNAFDIGITKNFTTKGKGKYYKLTMNFFEDKDGNYIRGEEEKPVVNQLIKVGNEVFRTDKNGTIKYKGIPPGKYEVSVLQFNGMTAGDTSIRVHSNKDVDIPMHQIGIISGNIKLNLGKYSFNTDKSVAGIHIIAIDKAGKRFETVTDLDGSFILYLPLNDYDIQVDVTTLPEKYICKEPVRSVHLSNGQNKRLTFNIWVEERQIKIKKFISSSIQ